MAPPSRVVSVTIKYAKPGTQPPVYLAGSFSNWEPQEMQYTDGEFIKEIQVEEGTDYQYKFRMGPGDWWVLCDDSPTATDDSGNKNNLLSVPESKQIEQSKDSLPATLPHTEHSSTSTNMNRVTEVTESPTVGPEINYQKPIIQNQEESPNMSLPTKISTEEDSNGSSREIDTQPIASPLQLPGASNDITNIPPRSKTPDIALVAAEVADSAAKLDNGPPSPEIPDDEAGRIGYRRMSNTPIPEVSETAAEVADVAAKLDRTKPSKIEMPSPPLSLEDEDIYAPTPEHERVPLFPHECPGPTDKVVRSRSGGSRDASPLIPSQQTTDEEIDTNDPSLESFPTTREGVYEKIRSLENRLPPDQSPVTSPSASRQPERLDLPSPSPRLLAHERSPSLGAIEEEHEFLNEVDRKPILAETGAQGDSEASQPISPTITRSKNSSTKNEQLETEVPKHEEGSRHSGDNQLTSGSAPAETFKGEPIDEAATEEPRVQANTKDNDPEVDVNTKSPIVTPISEPQKKGYEVSDASPANDVHETPDAEHTDTDRKTTDIEQTSSVAFPDTPGGPVKSSGEASGGETKAESRSARAPTITIQPATTHRETPISGATTLDSLSAVPQPVLTPFIVNGERQLGHGKEQNRELLPSDEGPSITLQPATPRASLRTTDTDLTETTDAGESTSIETSGRNSELASRKKQRAMTPSPDRPLTPSSMRSNKDVKSRNFLKAFWRVVFGWIPGLLARCFGGGRDSLVVVSALVLVVVPALYFYT